MTSDQVLLRATAHGGTLVIDVEDSGPGVAADAIDGIFDRFAAVAHAHHGTCTVTTSDAGSIFSLTLPQFRPTPAGAPRPSRQVRLSTHRLG